MDPHDDDAVDDEVGGGQAKDSIVVTYLAVSINQNGKIHSEILSERTDDSFALL